MPLPDRLRIEAEKAQQAADRRRAELAFMHNGNRYEPQPRPQAQQSTDYGLMDDLIAMGGNRKHGGLRSFDPYVLDPKPDPETMAAASSPTRTRGNGRSVQDLAQNTQPATATRKPQGKKLPAGLPETVTFYDAMGVQAARRWTRKNDPKRSPVSGGWRAYVLAKALDRQGLGMIKRDELQAYALALGVNIRTWQRWLNEARNHDLIIDIQKGKGADDWWLVLPGPAAAAYGMGCEVGRRKLEIKAELLVGKAWRAYVWAACEAAGPDGVQMTRETLQKVYNVPVSTQRYRDAQAGTDRQRHYTNSNIIIKPDDLAGVKDNGRKSAFIASNKKLYWRLADTRATDQAVLVGRGRSRKARAKLRTLQDQKALLQMQQGLTDGFEVSEYVRLYNRTTQQLKASREKLAAADQRIQEVYMYSHEAPSGAGIWEHCPR